MITVHICQCSGQLAENAAKPAGRLRALAFSGSWVGAVTDGRDWVNDVARGGVELDAATFDA